MANRRKRQENPVREWISDNLRYLILLLIVLIAALAAFLIYRQVSDRRSAAGTQTEAEATSATSATSASVSETASSSATSTESTSTEVVTATPSATPTETPTPTPLANVELTEMNPGANEAAENFIYSRQEEGVQYYESVHVQTFAGPKEGTYVAYADYDCKYDYAEYDGVVPRLTRMYLAPDESGALHEVPESEITPDENAYLSSVDQSEAVQNLIAELSARYNEVMDANPGLADYIAGLG